MELKNLKGLGDARIQKLNQFGIYTVRDLATLDQDGIRNIIRPRNRNLNGQHAWITFTILKKMALEAKQMISEAK